MTTKTTLSRTWYPARSAATRRHNVALLNYSRADTNYKRLRTYAEEQRIREQEIRHHGYEPLLYRPDLDQLLLTETHRLVRRWADPADIKSAYEALDKAELGLKQADLELEKARAAPGVTIDQLRKQASTAAGKADFIVAKHVRIDGTDYEPGQLLPRSVTDSMPYYKISGWTDGRAPTLERL